MQYYLAETSFPDALIELLRRTETQFALGVLVGALVSLALYYLTSKERRDFLIFVHESQKEQREQNAVKDARIAKLHDQIDRLLETKEKK